MGRPLTMPGFPDHAPVDEGRRSVRFNPDTGALEALAGRSQYGEAFDPWGRYFGSNNSNHIRMEMLAARYLQRNPDAPLSWGMADISDHGEAAKVFPITERPTFELLTEAGEFTSACSVTPYTGDIFDGEYRRSTFVAEPVHNLVPRDVIEPDGGGFRARRGGEAASSSRRPTRGSGRSAFTLARTARSTSSTTTGSASSTRNGLRRNFRRIPPSSRLAPTAAASTASSRTVRRCRTLVSISAARTTRPW